MRRDLRSLSKEAADRVAGHLVAAGLLADSDPAAALEHARAARAMGGRIGAVREAAGITAYLAGEYGEALAELRAARRLTGSPEHLALIADCERGLGRPTRALRVLEDPAAAQLHGGARIELLIVGAGARRDLGQVTAALAMLEVPELRQGEPQEWSVRLWYAYADLLLAADRAAEAAQWFAAVAAVDDGETDAAGRLREIEARGSQE